MDYAVQTRGICRAFGDVKAVDSIDLSIPKGEIYGLLGAERRGQDYARAHARYAAAAERGAARLSPAAMLSARRTMSGLRIGAALQDAALDLKQTGRELLRLQGRLYGLNRRELDTRLDDLAGLVNIGDALDRFIGTYSGGMKRRLDLAASLIHNPEVLFLDEPTTGLDPISRARVWEEVQRINKELSVTIFLTTQYLEEADALADRVGIISQGRLMAEGTPADLKRALGNDVIFVQMDGDADEARAAVAEVDGVVDVDASGGELIIHVVNGAAHISDVALGSERTPCASNRVDAANANARRRIPKRRGRAHGAGSGVGLSVRVSDVVRQAHHND